jgi:hypothetical protein
LILYAGDSTHSRVVATSTRAKAALYFLGPLFAHQPALSPRNRRAHSPRWLMPDQ